MDAQTKEQRSKVKAAKQEVARANATAIRRWEELKRAENIKDVDLQHKIQEQKAQRNPPEQELYACNTYRSVDFSEPQKQSCG